jgi:hypothetical protein
MEEAHLRPKLELFAIGASAAQAAALARTPHRVARETALRIAAEDSSRREAVLKVADVDLLVLATAEAGIDVDALARLRRTPREAVLEAVERALRDDLTAAGGACAAAGLGILEAIDDILAALRRAPIERRKLQNALVELGEARGVRALLIASDGLEALESAPAPLVERVAWAVLDDPRVVSRLAELSSEAYTPLLVEALRRRSRLQAIHALADLRHAPAVPHLIPLLDSRDAEDAHRALVMITGSPLGPRRSEWMHWWLTRRA